MAVVVVAACGGAGQAAPSPQAENTPTTAPTKAPTSQPLSAVEQKNDEDFFAAAVSFAQLLEGHFGVSASMDLPLSLEKGAFQVSVVRAGPFVVAMPDSGNEQYFRIDLKIENVGSEKATFAPDAMALSDDEGNQYESRNDASQRTLQLPDIDPGATHRGYVLFQSIPENTGLVRLSFELGRDETGSPYEFEYELKLSAD